MGHLHQKQHECNVLKQIIFKDPTECRIDPKK